MESLQLRTDPAFVFGSSIITIFVGALAFITALAWNSYVQELFEHYCNKRDERDAKLLYAFLVTLSAITISFLLMYYVYGEKW